MRVQNKILTSGFSFLLFVVQTAFPAEWVNESISVNDVMQRMYPNVLFWRKERSSHRL